MSWGNLYVYKGGDGDESNSQPKTGIINKIKAKPIQSLFFVILLLFVIVIISEYVFNKKIIGIKNFDMDAKAEAKPEAKVEIKPETKAEAKPEAKVEIKLETKAEANNIELIFKGADGTEKLKILDNQDRQLVGETIITIKQSETNKTGTIINFSTSERSFYIYYLNDSIKPRRDLYLKSIKLNGKELPLEKHIRGDIRFANDASRATSVSRGNFLWLTKDKVTSYRIDLDPRS